MRWLATVVAVFGLGLGAGCVDAEGAFTDGRLEDLCNGVVPVCNTSASCVLEDSRFVRSSFPGGQQVVVRSIEDGQQLRVRIFFAKMVYPGTTLLVEANSPDCATSDEELIQDVDIFDLAGDDLILDFELSLPDKGDHLLEVFSDMSADFVMTIDIE